MPIIEVPGQGEIEFPDDMADADIASAISKLSSAKPSAGGEFMSGMKEQGLDVLKGFRDIGSAAIDVSKHLLSDGVTQSGRDTGKAKTDRYGNPAPNRAKAALSGFVEGAKEGASNLLNPKAAFEAVTGLATGDESESWPKRAGRFTTSAAMVAAPFVPKGFKAVSKGVRKATGGLPVPPSTTVGGSGFILESANDLATRLKRESVGKGVRPPADASGPPRPTSPPPAAASPVARPVESLAVPDEALDAAARSGGESAFTEDLTGLADKWQELGIDPDSFTRPASAGRIIEIGRSKGLPEENIARLLDNSGYNAEAEALRGEAAGASDPLAKQIAEMVVEENAAKRGTPTDIPNNPVAQQLEMERNGVDHLPWGTPIEGGSAPTLAELRNLVGADEAGRRTGQTRQAVQEATGGPSRRPLKATNADLDNAYSRLINDERGEIGFDLGGRKRNLSDDLDPKRYRYRNFPGEQLRKEVGDDASVIPERPNTEASIDTAFDDYLRELAKRLKDETGGVNLPDIAKWLKEKAGFATEPEVGTTIKDQLGLNPGPIDRRQFLYRASGGPKRKFLSTTEEFRRNPSVDTEERMFDKLGEIIDPDFAANNVEPFNSTISKFIDVKRGDGYLQSLIDQGDETPSLVESIAGDAAREVTGETAKAFTSGLKDRARMKSANARPKAKVDEIPQADWGDFTSESGAVTPQFLKDIGSVANQARMISMLSGLALPKSILGNASAIGTAAFEKGSLKPLAEAARVPTNLAEMSHGWRTSANPSGISGMGKINLPGRIMGTLDHTTQRILERAGLSADQANRLLLTRPNPVKGNLGKMVKSPIGKVFWPWQRTPFNSIIEGLSSENFKGGTTGETMRKTALTAGAAGGGALLGQITDDPKILGLAAALSGVRGVPMLFGAGFGGAGRRAMSGVSPMPEWTFPTDLKGLQRLAGLEPAAIRAYGLDGGDKGRKTRESKPRQGRKTKSRDGR